MISKISPIIHDLCLHLPQDQELRGRIAARMAHEFDSQFERLRQTIKEQTERYQKACDQRDEMEIELSYLRVINMRGKKDGV